LRKPEQTERKPRTIKLNVREKIHEVSEETNAKEELASKILKQKLNLAD